MFQEQLQPYFPVMFLSLYALGIAYYLFDVFKTLKEDPVFTRRLISSLVDGGFTDRMAVAIVSMFAAIYVAAWPMFAVYQIGQSLRRAWFWRQRLKGAKKVGNIYYARGVAPPESPKEERKDR